MLRRLWVFCRRCYATDQTYSQFGYESCAEDMRARYLSVPLLVEPLMVEIYENGERIVCQDTKSAESH